MPLCWAWHMMYIKHKYLQNTSNLVHSTMFEFLKIHLFNNNLHYHNLWRSSNVIPRLVLDPLGKKMSHFNWEVNAVHRRWHVSHSLPRQLLNSCPQRHSVWYIIPHANINKNKNNNHICVTYKSVTKWITVIGTIICIYNINLSLLIKNGYDNNFPLMN